MQSFNPPARVLMGPGPSDVSPRVLQALARPTIGHLDPAFQGFRQTLNVVVNPSGAAANSIRFGFATGFQLGDRIVYQGTGISGLKAQNALQGAGIIANKNTIPYDTRSPFIGSGLRMGTPALTSRGMGTDDMKRIAAWIVRVLKDPDGDGVRETVRNEVAEFARPYPVPGITDA